MKRAKRIVSLLLMLCMVISMIPAAVAAKSLPFTDLNKTDWFYDAVAYVYENGMMSGTGDSSFSPNATTTRGMIVTILHRLEGEPSARGEDFADVAANAYYADAVAWASDKGVVTGYGNGCFGPNDAITRQQLAAILFRYAAFCGKNTKARALFDDFKDAYAVADWAVDAMQWARAQELLQGNDGYLTPNGFATRAQVATVLERFCGTPSGGFPDFIFDHDDEEDEDEKTYTVSFDSNGGSSVPSQSVKHGKKAEEPANPVKSGCEFEGWYTDKALNNKYDFKTAVKDDLTLYAKWNNAAADDAVDEEDTTITAGDFAYITSDIDEVIASEATYVKFYVTSSVTVEKFDLYCEGIGQVGSLYDNGDYDGSFDDIPNDGCYTGRYLITGYTEDIDLYFYASADVGNQTIETEKHDVFVYTLFTEEELDDVNEVNTNVMQLMESADESLPETATEKEKADARYALVNAYLKSISDPSGENYIIKELTYDAETYTFDVVFAKSGINSYYIMYEEADVFNFSNETLNAEDADSYDSLKYAVLTDDNYITYKEKACILTYCPAVAPANENDNVAVRSRNYANDFADYLEEKGFEVDNKFAVTVEDFKNLSDYNFISTICHGTTLGSGLSKTPVICTDESVTDNKYSADIKKNRITAGNGSYFIRPEFFDYYYSETKLKCSVFYVNVCKGAANDKLAEAIVDAGASSVLAYSDTVSVTYCLNMLSSITEDLFEGKTVDQALSAAQTEHGINDGGDTPAECLLFGEDETKLHHNLYNGKFDSVVNLLGTGLVSWKRYGDTRSIYKLAGLKPKSNPKMAIISSGFGAMNGSTTSSIYQTFLVPENANTIEFYYDVVSEEPMEYVGSNYNDIFRVDILNTDGEVLDTIAYESVNASAWYAISGINFPGGDDTTFHTRWKFVQSDAIADYREQLVVLRFVVQDAGDAVFDTAALIDSVVVK